MGEKRLRRREALGLGAGAAVAAGATLVPGTAGAKEQEKLRRRPAEDLIPRQNIGIQLYSLRDMQAASVSSTIAMLSGIGYPEVELFTLQGQTARAWRDIFDATGVRALAALRNEGLIERIGLCNVNVSQIEEARRITEISAVQVELSLWRDTNVLNGVVQYCIAHGLQLIAYRPLGGSRHARRVLSDPLLTDVASRHGATAHEIALAWLLAQKPWIVPIPGTTQMSHMIENIRAAAVRFTPAELGELNRSVSAIQIRGARLPDAVLVFSGVEAPPKP